MRKLKLAIIFGGASNEYEISLKSASSVIENIDKDRYELVLIGISREGDWFKYEGDISKIAENTWLDSKEAIPAFITPDKSIHGIVILEKGTFIKERIDLVFPVIHGKGLEDGSIQGLLELSGIPYIGSRVLASSMCMDKDITHKIAELAGVKVPKSKILKERDTDYLNIDLKYPLFVKPANEGSSIGITKAYDTSQLKEAVELAFKYDKKVIIEEAIEGFEVGCAVLGISEPIIGRVDEIEVASGFLDYNEKYLNRTATIYVPARIDEETEKRIKAVALKVYKALDCKGLARVDMFLTPQKEIYLNEVNTLPGLTLKSRYPDMLKEAGISFREMIDKLIEEETLSKL